MQYKANFSTSHERLIDHLEFILSAHIRASSFRLFVTSMNTNTDYGVIRLTET